ncbi:MAG TPA: adenylate kinase [Chloroflexia bacterium]|nr:adenylate kinase [Chloroflexia bacterium]
MIIILIGGPGAGKGTQSEILEEQLQMVHVSSGDLLRDHVKRGTELGKAADKYMSEGKLVPDKLVIDMIEDRLLAPDTEHGVLLDGFPRTEPQARALDDALDLKGRAVNMVLYINVDDETMIDRISGRLMCRKCGHIFHEKFMPPKVPGVCDECGSELYQREDDTRETAIKRVASFHQQTKPIVEYYRSRGVLCEVDGSKPVEEVTSYLLSCLR